MPGWLGGGRGGWRPWPAGSVAPKGYTYNGPCRCGFGPDAYYQDESGRIIHASQLFRGVVPLAPAVQPTKEELQAQLKRCETEKAEIEKRLKQLEGQSGK